MDNELIQFVNLLKSNFYMRLQKKTGWGRNQIWFEFNLAISETALGLARNEKKELDNERKNDNEQQPINTPW